MRLSAPALRRIAWFALGCHVLVGSGLPLPVAPATGDRDAAARLAAKDRSRPFPCMDKACGCATAEQCFANCCCHTPAERLAWAKARDVAPAVLAALERRVAHATVAPASRSADSCCTAHEMPAPARDGPDVCSAYRSLAAAPATPAAVPPTPVDDDAPAARAPRTVILRDMLVCGGSGAAWLACGTALPPPPRIEPPSHDAPAGAIAPRDECAASVSTDLSVPPPRVG